MSRVVSFGEILWDKLPSGKVLKGKERKKFEVAKIKLDVLKSNLISKSN